MKLAGGLLVVAAALFTTISARAEVVANGPFSVDIKGADMCVIAPAALRTGAHCEGLDVPDAAAFDAMVAQAKVRLLWCAIVRGPNGGPSLGVVQVLHSPGNDIWPDQHAADELTKSYAKDVVAELGGATKSRISDLRIVRNGDTRVVRATMDFEGAPPTPAARAAEHQELAATFTQRGTYLLLVGGPRSEEAALRAVATESVPTIALDAAAQPHQGKNISEAVGRLSVYLAMAIAGGAIYLSRKRTKARQEAWLRQQAAQYPPHPQYPPPGDPR
jgi:hypothetical protein